MTSISARFSVSAPVMECRTVHLQKPGSRALGRALVKVLLLMLLAPVWAIPAWSSENGEPVVSNELAAEFAAAAEWIRSGDYLLARENADAGVDVPIVRPYVLEIEDNWRQARKTASGSGLSFCVSAQNQLQEIDAELTPLRPLVAGAVARLLNVQTNTLLNLNTQAMLNLVSDNQDMHAALERLRFLLMSVRQFEEDASLLWRATWACETGTFRLDGWGFAAGETQIAQMSLNTVIRSLLDSGVKDFVFNGTMLPPLKLARLKLDSISIENSVVQGLELQEATLANLKITDSLLVRCTADGACNGVFSLANSEISGDVDLNRVDVFGSLYAADATIGGNIYLRDSRFNRIESTRRSFQARFEKESGSASQTNEFPPEVEALLGANTAREWSRKWNSLSLFAARVDGTLTITDSEFTGLVFLGRSRLGELRMAGSFVDGKLDLWGATVTGPSFIGHGNSGARQPGVTVTGEIHAWYATFDDLQMGNLWVGDKVVLKQAKIDGFFSVADTDIRGALWAEGLRANMIHFTRTSTTQADLRSSLINGEFIVEASRIGKLTMVLARMRGFSAYTAYTEDEQIRPESECLSLVGSDERPPVFGVSGESRQGSIKHLRPNCFGSVDVGGAVIDSGLYLAGHLDQSINLNEAQISGTTRLGGLGMAYSAKACVRMRDAVLGTIILDPNAAENDGKPLPGPAAIDAFGAKYDLVRASNPLPIDRRQETAMVSVKTFLGQPGKTCEDEGLVDDPQDGEEGIRYTPGIYDGLARGYEATGDIDMARAVKIEKNRAYARGLEKLPPSIGVMLERAVYFLSDIINGFGYRNVNAVIWLVGLVTTGYLLSWIAAATAGRRSRDPASLGAIAMASGHVQSRPAPRMNLFMFSLDRAIPSLALDTTFGTHLDKPMPGWLSVWFYVQRIACFLIIILMIAGAFEVFQ